MDNDKLMLKNMNDHAVRVGGNDSHGAFMTTFSNKLASGTMELGDEPLLTITEVCDWLNICETTLMKLRKRKLLIPVPIEGSVRFRPADVRALIAGAQEEERAKGNSGPTASGPCTRAQE